MADFIPQTDDEFNNFLTALNAFVASPAGAGLDLAPGTVTALAGATAHWATAWSDWQAEQNTYAALLAAKNAARAGATVILRQINATAQANPNVTATTKQGGGLPVHKTTRTPAPVPDTHPVLYRVDNEHLLQRLWFSDQNTVGKLGKPKGVEGCEIRQQVVAAGGAAPVDPDAMPYLATDTKSPHRTDLEADELGKTAYYCQRWVNSTGQPGPWGPITGYPVT